MKNLREPKTTISGIVVIATSLVMVLTKNATITETSGWFTLGFALLGANDKMMKP